MPRRGPDVRPAFPGFSDRSEGELLEALRQSPKLLPPRPAGAPEARKTGCAPWAVTRSGSAARLTIVAAQPSPQDGRACRLGKRVEFVASAVSEPHHDALPSFGDDDPVSPELALVDSALRQRLLQAEVNRVQADRTLSPAPLAATGSPVESSATIHPDQARRGRRGWIAIIGALLVVAAGAAAVWQATLPRATPAPAVPPAAPTNSVTTATTEAAAGRPATRTFAWASASGALAYHVEIRRGNTIVYSTRTSATHISVRLRRAGKKTALLKPGTYRWYVWPLLRHGHARRRGAAIVATTIVVRG